jgi:hypothetical protein
VCLSHFWGIDVNTAVVFEEVRKLAGGPGSKAYIAAVGKWLSNLGLHPATLPHRLSVFLAKQHGYCEVRGDFVVFGDGPAPTTMASRQPRRERRQRQRQQQSSEGEGQFRRDLWTAFIADRPGHRWFLDLDDLATVEVPFDGTARGAVATAPEQYIEIPTLSTDAQRQHAILTLAPRVGEDSAQQLTAGAYWWPTLQRDGDSSLVQAMLTARASWVASQITAWIALHGLPMHVFLRAKQSPEEIVELRACIHRAVDQMTPAELGRLSQRLPARFLGGGSESIRTNGSGSSSAETGSRK